jgi:hypothetical protein
MKRTTILAEAIAFMSLAACGAAIDTTTPSTGGSTGRTTTSSSSSTSGGSTGSTTTGGATSGTTGTSGCTPTPPWDTASPELADEAPAASTTAADDDNVDPKCLAACDAAKDACIAPCKDIFNKLVLLQQLQWLQCVTQHPVEECLAGLCTFIYTTNVAKITAWRNACQSPCWTAFNQCQTDCGVKNNN